MHYDDSNVSGTIHLSEHRHTPEDLSENFKSRNFSRIDWVSWNLILAFLLGAFTEFRKAAISFVTFSSVGSHRRFSWNLISEYFSKICPENSPLFKNLTRITDILLEDVYTFMIVSRWSILMMRNVSGKSCRENQNTTLCSITFFRKSYRLWDDVNGFSRNLISVYFSKICPESRSLINIWQE